MFVPRFVQKIGNFNIDVYYDKNYDEDGRPWNLVVVDKFTPTGTYVGKKSFYFSPQALYMRNFHVDELQSLWELPDNTKIVGGRWVWETM